MPVLRIEIQGSLTEVPLPVDRAVQIGSGAEADLRLAADGVAPLHCRLDPLPDGRVRLRDLGSGQETRVDGVAVRQVSLKPGNVIGIGSLELAFADGAGSAAPAAVAPKAVSPKAVTPKAVTSKAVSPKPAPAKAAAPAAVAAKPAASAKPASTGSVSEPVASGAAPAAPRRAARRGSGSRLLVPLAVLVLGGVGAMILAKGFGNEKETQLAAAKSTYDKAVRLIESGDIAGARPILEALASDTNAGRWRESAERRLDRLGSRGERIQAAIDTLWSQRLELTADALRRERALLIEDFGADAGAPFDAFAARVRAAQTGWREDQVAVATREVETALKSGQFADALEIWRGFGRRAPGAVDVTAAVTAGREQVEGAARDGLAKLLDAAGKRTDPRVASEFLASRMGAFRGTGAEADLRAAIRRFDEAAELARATPTPAETTPTQPGPGTPSETGPVADASIDYAALQSRVVEATKLWAFADAAKAVRALGTLPREGAGAWWTARAGDLDVAEAAFVKLLETINASPERFKNVPVQARMRGNLTEVDRKGLRFAVRGGTSKSHWERVGKTLLPELVKRLDPKGEAAMPLATLLSVRDQGEAAEIWLFRAGQTGASKDVVFATLARWRGETVPEGGYVEHEGAYVTPARREFLVREARIAEALGKIAHRDVEVRKEAYETLLAIGEPAAARFREALLGQRMHRIDEVAKSKRFTSSKTKTKLFAALEQRRRDALTLIRDAQAYPYPNPNKLGQKRVEELVDLVREVWERPFDLVATWDEKLSEELTLVTEVDTVLARLDASYRPDLDAMKERINKAIDMPGFAPGGEASIRDYSNKVMAFNERVKLTATEQEKDNTRAVNEYRIMMGLRAVKINERLLRGSRGHSRHMREKRYFAHNVPAQHATPENRTPGTRAKQQGYGGGVGENIAMGPGTGRGAFWAWFGSSGHHRNMLGANWTEMGCGRSGSYWTQLFGAAGGRSLAEPDPLPAPAAPFAPEPEGNARGRRGAGILPDDRDGPGNGAFR